MVSHFGEKRMIDKLVLRCEFKRDVMLQSGEETWSLYPLAALGIPTDQSITAEGEVYATRHPWETIPSSYEDMAFKVFDNRTDCAKGFAHFFCEIKASPAKIMQGHNVYGSSDIYDCSITLIELLLNTYPQLGQYLDFTSWYMAQIDLTYSSRAVSNDEARLFINALQNVSYGQTRGRTGFDGTAYFGKKNSRLKKIKVYSKSPEVQQTILKNEKRKDGEIHNEVFTQELLDFSIGLIRWEVSLYHRYLERMGISCYLKDIFKNQTLTPTYCQRYWQAAISDLFTALEGQHMKILNDNDIQTALRALFTKTSEKTGKTSTALADSAYRTYRDIRRDGWAITRSLGSIRTFDRHVKMLQECGLSRAALQNMTGLDDGAQIIPFVRFIQVDFANQFPDGYVQPEPRHVYQPTPTTLRLVA
jgi:II/X family phage/plasmid replication protein